MSVQDLGSLPTEELLRLYKKSDLAAFNTFYARTKGIVFGFLLSRLRNRADAEEALQDTYLRVHKYILTYDNTQPALPWLMTIARNSLLNIVKKRGPLSAVDPDTIASESHHDSALETRNLLEQLLSELQPKDRALLESRLLSDLSYEDLALETGMSPDNARQKISRILRKLKAALSS